MSHLIIFDLDGTLSLPTSREHYVRQTPPDWEKFTTACDTDEPNIPVTTALRAHHAAGAEIRIWSGRFCRADIREKTFRWLERNRVPFHQIRMRPEGVYIPDQILKKNWLTELSTEDRNRLLCVYDDRKVVVDMWRKNGVVCFQVAPGDF